MSDGLTEHITKYVDKAKRGASSFIMDMTDFSRLAEKYRCQKLPKATFQSVDHYPPCTKYSYPDKVTFKDPGKMHFDDDRAVFEVSIQSLIALDEDHFLNLHPVRFDVIKEEISKGFIHVPLVGMECGKPTVTCGRHRIIALKTLGVSVVPISISITEKSQIENFLSLREVTADYTLAIPNVHKT